MILREENIDKATKTNQIFIQKKYSGIQAFVTVLRALLIKEDMDALIGVSGFKGMGKSTFSIQVARLYFKNYLPDKKFVLEKSVAYSFDDVLRVIDENEPYTPIVCDEAVNFAMAEDWSKAESRKLKKIFAKVRDKHHIFFFNIPNMWWLDRKYRESMMTVWTHILKKGYAVISLPNLAPGIDDVWHKDFLRKRFQKVHFSFFSDVDDIMKIFRKYPCYFDEFTFPKLPEKLYEKHLELRNAQSTDTFDESDAMRRLAFKLRLLPYDLIRFRFDELYELMTKIKNNGGIEKYPVKDLFEFVYRDPQTKEPLFSVSNASKFLNYWRDRAKSEGVLRKPRVVRNI